VTSRLRRAVKTALLRTRFPLRQAALRVGLRVYEAYIGSRARLRGGGTPERGPDGLAVPPPELRARVSQPPDATFFLESGRSQVESIRELIADHGVRVDSMRAALDFGCGCGRLARWWADVQGPALHGCDYDRDLVVWCSRNLPFMEATVNDLDPPLGYEAEQFDLVYALSVFTHMSESLQHRWLAELERVLRPGGLLFFTVSGDEYADRLSGEDRARYDSAELVTHFTEVEGSNLCAAYHPPRYVKARMLSGLELLEMVPGAPFPAPTTAMSQDGYLARKADPHRG
jgi:SAM-dependent methyltransferase